MKKLVKHYYCEYCQGEMEPTSEHGSIMICPYCGFAEWTMDIDDEFIEEVEEDV